MKNSIFKLAYPLFLSLILLLSFFGCDKDELINGTDTEKLSTESKPEKINVCHYSDDDDQWILINVSENSWSAHSQHGDVRLDDQDGDGFVPYNECGFGEMGDCDDNDAAVNPGAIEICGNGIDDNCNGVVDETCIACIDYEWAEYLDSLDLSRACFINFGPGIVLFTFGLDGNTSSSGLYVGPGGRWQSGPDNGNQAGIESPESFECFQTFLVDNELANCNNASRPSSSQSKDNPFVK